MLFTSHLKDPKIFTGLIRNSKKYSCPAITVFYRQNNLPYSRLGISVGKKVGHAVERNRAKRIIRAAYTECETALAIGYDYVIIVRPAVNGMKSSELVPFFRGLSRVLAKQ